MSIIGYITSQRDGEPNEHPPVNFPLMVDVGAGLAMNLGAIQR
jgi:hypothetical protein